MTEIAAEPGEIEQLEAQFLQAGSARYQGKSIHAADDDDDVIWGTDEYGCDAIASPDPTDVRRAIRWLTTPSGPWHPAAFGR